jgi:iron(III) transport system permease protein
MTSDTDILLPRRNAWSLARVLRGQHLLFVAHVAVILFLCVLILYPAAILLDLSFRDDNGALTLANYVSSYTKARNLEAILNTVVISAGTAFVSVVVGTFLGWAVVRTDMPGRKVIELASIIPFISSPLIGALAWILLAAPHTGLINQASEFLGGSNRLIEIYSVWGIIFVETLYEAPIVFLLVAGALRTMNPTLEEASLSSGAGIGTTALRVTLPLVAPSILAGALLVFILAAEQFGVPALIGSPAKIRVLTTSIWEVQSTFPPQTGLAAALSATLLAIALVALWLHKKMLGARSFTTVSGKSAQPRRIALGRWARWAVFAVAACYLLLAVVLPVATIFVSSIRTMWTADFHWDQLTLAHYYDVLFNNQQAQRAIVNSLFIAVVGATVTILLCAFISFLSLRVRLPGSKFLDALTMIPLGFPGIVLAVGLLYAWINPPLVLYGTIWILFVAYMTRYIPLGVRSVSATLTQIHPELEESSQSSGANWFKTFWHVTLPLLRPGIFAGWALLFVAFTRELSASILLFSPNREVLSVVIFDMYGEGNFRQLSALTTLQILIAVVVLALARLVSNVDKSEEVQAIR